MDIHPLTNYEIARLRNEERLVRAERARRAMQAREEQTAELLMQPSRRVRLLRAIRRRGAFVALGRAIVFRALLITGVLFGVTSIALAHSSRWAWTEPKAEQIVARDAVVRLAPIVRAPLERGLRASSEYYRGLAIGLREEPHQSPNANEAGEYVLDKLFSRSRAALTEVRSGLKIDAADCRGLGAGVRGGRFARFRCVATSEPLVIPSAVVAFSEDGKIRAVTEGKPRRVGPFQARLDVRVSGRSTIAYRKIG